MPCLGNDLSTDGAATSRADDHHVRFYDGRLRVFGKLHESEIERLPWSVAVRVIGIRVEPVEELVCLGPTCPGKGDDRLC